MSAAGENHPEIIKLLVEHGADVNAQGAKLDYSLIVRQDVMSLPPVGGLTPLMDAARENSYEAAEALLKAGANPNLKSPEKMTALIIAITNLHWDVARLLIDNGADVNDGSVAQVEEMRNLKTTLSRPVSRGPHNLTSMDVMKALLEKGAKADSVIPGEVPTRSGGPGRGGDVPALVRAAKTADIEVMRVLLDHNADPKAAGKDGQSALIAAVGTAGGRGGGFGIGAKTATDEERIAAMKMIVERGGDVNAADAQGQTPLHAAAAKGSDEMVQFLVDHGAKLDAKDKRDHTPLDIANGKGGGPARGVIGATEPVVHDSTVALLRKLMGLPPEEKKLDAKKAEGEAPSADGNNNNQ
jgi:ankyrin